MGVDNKAAGVLSEAQCFCSRASCCGAWGTHASAHTLLFLKQESEAQRFSLEQRILELEAGRMEHWVRAEDAAALAGA